MTDDFTGAPDGLVQGEALDTREPGEGTLVILRHGESEFNRKQVFTGLLDADVTDAGLAQIEVAARLLTEAGLVPDRIITSPMLRAVRTTDRLLSSLVGLGAISGPTSVPVDVSWRLNERDYGILTGVSKSTTRSMYGEDAFFAWRRTLHGRPPAASPQQVATWVDPAPVAGLGPLVAGAGESLADVITRVEPFWNGLAPQLTNGTCIVVVAHGNSLRALAAVMDALEPSEIEELNIPAGHPLVYRVSDTVPSPRGGFYLDDDAARVAARLVAAEGGT